MQSESIHPNNILNDLSAKEYMKHKRSHFVINAAPEKEYREGVKSNHPATFPKNFVQWMLECYTKNGQTVLDPMSGSGTTVVQATLMGRKGIGFDYNPKYIAMAKEILDMYYPTNGHKRPLEPILWSGEALENVRLLSDNSVHYVLFSPPYVDMLHRSSGGVITRHKKRLAKGLSGNYESDPGDKRDLGNLKFLGWWTALLNLADELYRVTLPGHYMTIVVQNKMRINMNPIAWKLAIGIIEHTPWVLKPEQIWCQQEKKTTIHGWDASNGFVKSFIVNNHHHYCLNFQKPLEEKSK